MTHLPATRAFVAEMLRHKEIRLAYPLMREVLPGLTVQAWLKYARRTLACSERNRGILVVRRKGVTQLLGAVCYERCIGMHGAVLRAEPLIALDLLYPDRVVAALAAGLDAVASHLGCGSIRAASTVAPSEAVDMLLTCGYHLAGLALIRDVTPVA